MLLKVGQNLGVKNQNYTQQNKSDIAFKATFAEFADLVEKMGDSREARVLKPLARDCLEIGKVLQNAGKRYILGLDVDNFIPKDVAEIRSERGATVAQINKSLRELSFQPSKERASMEEAVSRGEIAKTALRQVGVKNPHLIELG